MLFQLSKSTCAPNEPSSPVMLRLSEITAPEIEGNSEFNRFTRAHPSNPEASYVWAGSRLFWLDRARGWIEPGDCMVELDHHADAWRVILESIGLTPNCRRRRQYWAAIALLRMVGLPSDRHYDPGVSQQQIAAEARRLSGISNSVDTVQRAQARLRLAGLLFSRGRRLVTSKGYVPSTNWHVLMLPEHDVERTTYRHQLTGKASEKLFADELRCHLLLGKRQNINFPSVHQRDNNLELSLTTQSSNRGIAWGGTGQDQKVCQSDWLEEWARLPIPKPFQ